MGSAVSVAVIGAGPYGLSVAAHLAALGCKPQVFGRSMETWRSFMPKGMVLKSEGFAMDLSDPARSFTLEDFCRERHIPYAPTGWPVPVEVFAAYGKAFQERFVPQLDETQVARVTQVEGGFELRLETGETVFAHQVVLATGIRSYARFPDAVAALPASKVTHSADHGDMAEFAGRHVAVLGGGASAMDVAAALHRGGATATVVTRRADVRFHPPTSFRSVRDRLLAPMTPLGPGWKKFLCVKLPDLFHALPERLRLRIVSRYLGPAPAWSVRDIVEDHVDLRLESEVRAAGIDGAKVALSLAGPEGETTLKVDHVIAATGYDVDLDRLSMLSPSLRAVLRKDGRPPALTLSFESIVPGLFFVGTVAAAGFGPMLRFVCGADFAAHRVAEAIAKLDRPTTLVERPVGPERQVTAGGVRKRAA